MLKYREVIFRGATASVQFWISFYFAQTYCHMSHPVNINISDASAMTKGGLLRRIRSVSANALQVGALQPIETTSTMLATSPPFLVRVVQNLARKAEATVKRNERKEGGEKREFNPFLPYDEDLYVEDMGVKHVLLLNKYNVVGDHVLIVTKKFEEQGDLLSGGDMEGMWECLKEVDGVGFYNSGRISGASQRHKHLQVICGSVGDMGEVEGVAPFDGILTEWARKSEGEMFRARELEYWHVGVGMEGVEGGTGCMEKYMRLIGEVMKDERAEKEGSQLAYNLVVTRRWMVVVPRRNEYFRGVSVNALGFVGCLLVKEQGLLDVIKEVGGMRVLKETGFEE